MLEQMKLIREARGGDDAPIPDLARRQHVQSCEHSHQPIVLTKEKVMVCLWACMSMLRIGNIVERQELKNSS